MRFFPLPCLISLAFLAPLAQAEEVQGFVLPIKSVSVASPVLQEVVEKVLVEEGETVTDGQLLVKLHDTREDLAVQEAQKVMENAEYVAKGAEALYREHMGSRDLAMKSTTDLELAKIRLAAAKEALREKTIRAPLNGIVVKKYKEAGESVDRAEKLMDIVNIDQVYVQFYLDPKLMTVLQPGQPIVVTFAVLNNVTKEAKVDFIDARVDASSGLFRVKLLLDNADHKVKAGMRGTADFAKLMAAK